MPTSTYISLRPTQTNNFLNVKITGHLYVLIYPTPRFLVRMYIFMYLKVYNWFKNILKFSDWVHWRMGLLSNVVNTTKRAEFGVKWLLFWACWAGPTVVNTWKQKLPLWIVNFSNRTKCIKWKAKVFSLPLPQILGLIPNYNHIFLWISPEKKHVCVFFILPITIHKTFCIFHLICFGDYYLFF